MMGIEYLSAIVLILISFLLWVAWIRFCIAKVVSPMALLALVTFNIFILRPVILIFGLDVPNPEYLFDDIYSDIARAQLYVVFWILGLFLYGLYFNYRNPVLVGRLLPIPPEDINYSKLGWILLFFVFMSFLVALDKLRLYGSYDAILYAAKIEKQLAGSSFLRQIPGIGMVLAAICLVRSIRIRQVFMACVYLASLVFNISVFYMWGAREAVAIVLLGIVILLSQGQTNYLNKKKFAFGIGLMVLLSTVAYMVRLKSLGASESAMDDKSIFSTISISLHMVRYDAFMLLVRDWNFPSEIRWGGDLLLGNLAAIPRVIWEAKPEQVVIGAWFRQLYEPYSINGWPISVVGQWVMSFHWFGVVLGSYVTANIFKSIEEKYRNLNSIFGFYFMIFFCVSVFQNGSILQFLPEYILWIFPLIFIGKLASNRRIKFVV